MWKNHLNYHQNSLWLQIKTKAYIFLRVFGKNWWYQRIRDIRDKIHHIKVKNLFFKRWIYKVLKNKYWFLKIYDRTNFLDFLVLDFLAKLWGFSSLNVLLALLAHFLLNRLCSNIGIKDVVSSYHNPLSIYSIFSNNPIVIYRKYTIPLDAILSQVR